MLDANLEAYWRGEGKNADLASDIVREALEAPPPSAKLGARALQVARRHPPEQAYRAYIDEQLAPHVADLRRRLAQIDQIANPETEPQAIAEILGDEADGIDWSSFDPERLRSERSGAGGRARGAAAFIDSLGWENLAEQTQVALRRALDDLRSQERFHAQALLVGPGGEGFVIGLQIDLRDDGELLSDEALDAGLMTQAKQALHRAFGDSAGGQLELEWQLPAEGPSIGLALVVAGHVAGQGLDVDPLTAATGEVDVNGNVRGVQGISSKLQAAADAGIRRVLLPEDNHEEAQRLPAAEALELLFVDDVSAVKRTLARMPSGVQLGMDGRKRMIRGAHRECGFDLEHEAPLKHGYQFKLSGLDGTATITLYDSGKVVVGGVAKPKARAEGLVAKFLPAIVVEPRSALALQNKSPERQERVQGRLLAIDAEELAPNQHESWRFRLQRGPSTATVVQYASGKLLLQGNAPAWDEAREVLKAELDGLGGAEGLDAVPDLVKVRERRAQSDEAWIGTDESGKGDYFGPLVSAAVFTDPDNAELLAEMGVADSKKLSDKRVFALAPKLRETLGTACYVTVIKPERFNSLYAEMRAEGKRLNAMLAWGHTRSIESLLERGLSPGYAIVDQFADVRFIDNALLSEARRSKLEILQFPKAEMDMAVAAASILAREAFLNWLATMSAQLGLKLPKGAGPQVVEAGRELVEKLGEEELRKYAKLSFKTTGKVLA